MFINTEILTNFVVDIFQAAGTPDAYARLVAESLVRTNRTGHDSHGVVRVETYLDGVAIGEIKPEAGPIVVQETGGVTIVDGQFGFGQVTAHFAMQETIEKAKQHGVAATGLQNCNHVGRLGEWVEMAAAENMIGLAFCNVYNSPTRRVAPLGGTRPLFGTNPLAAAIPVANQRPILLDFSTSIVSEGKVRLARNQNTEVPEGWLLDANGQPTQNPHNLYDCGALLPMAGYKGFGLLVLTELLGGVLMGTTGIGLPGQISRNGVLFIVLSVDAFGSMDAFLDQTATFYTDVKAEPSADGLDEILLPGDPETNAINQRGDNIPLDEPTWQLLRKAATELGVEIPG
ncbi:MAG: Ldh family oxidoreductase [Chloroflexota bacterium]